LTLLYLDASAITKLVVAEAESRALRARVQGERLVSSRIAFVEVSKAVARANPDADAGPVLARLALVELDAELARIAAAAGGSGLRALDAIHLASALRVARDIAAFVTYDDHQAAAVEAAGLPVETPA
jgi:predicted nucleic acid-binding protein